MDCFDLASEVVVCLDQVGHIYFISLNHNRSIQCIFGIVALLIGFSLYDTPAVVIKMI